MKRYRFLFVVILFFSYAQLQAHPLRLSLCEIEYSADSNKITVNLKLFLQDVNEALVFDPDSDELAFCQSNESKNAESLLLKYLNQFFYLKVNQDQLKLNIKQKSLKGEGDNTALWVYFEYDYQKPIKTLEIKNAVFTDLFYDQNNIVYIHINKDSKSLMLNKQGPIHQLKF